MNGKQKALKALCVLAVAIALCMFFSRTVQTITTPKIQRITATKGKLEEKISLSAQIYFPETEDVTVKNAKKLGVTIDSVKVRAGYKVEKGDVIYTASASEYETKRKEIQDNYDKKVKELAEHRAGSIRLATTSVHNDTYNAMLDAHEAYYRAQYAARLAAQEAGYALPQDEASWAELPDAPQAVQEAAAKAVEAGAALDAAVLALKRVYITGNGRVGEATFDFIKKLDQFKADLADLQKQLLELDLLNESLQEITAPHAGYITQVALKQGDSYDGTKPAFTISQENAVPALRADISAVTKTLSKGNKAALESGASTQVTEIVQDPDGKKYALLELTEEALRTGGGMSRMIGESAIPVTVTYKAAKNTTLLPASAVRQDNDNSYYVYVVSRNYGVGLLGGSEYTVKKSTVTILEKTDKLVSLGEDLQYTEIADREDRALTDGQAVMDYVD